MLVYTSCIQDLDWTLGGGGGAYVSLHKLYTGPGLDSGVVGVRCSLAILCRTFMKVVMSRSM